jgi:sugar lactone lactonase YvrE
MMRKWLLACVVSVIALAGAQEVVVDGLNNPMGLLVTSDGTVWVVDSGHGGDEEIEMMDPQSGETTTVTVGMTSAVVAIAPDGTRTVRAMLPSVALPMENLGGSRLASLGTEIYATSGGWIGDPDSEPMPLTASVVRVDTDEPQEVASTWTIEAEENPGGFIFDSHPYGIVGGADGMLYVADAGANTLLRVDPSDGDVTVLAVFDGVPGPFPNPARDGAMETDPVPTGITQGPDGTLYVALLPGFPFTPGSASVQRVTLDGDVTQITDGLTMVTDLQLAPDGHLYAVTLAEFTETGPTPMSGAVTRVGMDGEIEVVLEGLMFSTAIAFAPNGDAYVAVNGLGAPGTGQVLRYEGLGAP